MRGEQGDKLVGDDWVIIYVLRLFAKGSFLDPPKTITWLTSGRKSENANKTEAKVCQAYEAERHTFFIDGL